MSDSDFYRDIGFDNDMAKFIAESSVEIKKRDIIHRIPTGSLVLDQMIGGGWPMGRSSEIQGLQHTGKTTIALMGAAQLLNSNPDATVLFIDYEEALDWDYVESIGIIDYERFIVAGAGCSEDALNLIRGAIKSKVKAGEGFDMIILDSVAVLQARARQEGTLDDMHFALEARAYNSSNSISDCSVLFFIKFNVYQYKRHGRSLDTIWGKEARTYKLHYSENKNTQKDYGW